MAKLTIKTLEALDLTNMGESVHDGAGLRGRIRANKQSKKGVSVTFVYRFRWQNSSLDYPCGTWPADTMPAIRQICDEARLLVKKGVNPIEKKKIDLQAQQDETIAKLAEIASRKIDDLTINDLFEEWVPNTDRKDKGAELRRSFGRDVLPQIGATPIRAIAEKDMRRVLNAVVERGANRLAVMMLADLKQMFRWAEKRRPWKKLIEDNPVEHLEAKHVSADDYDGAERTHTLSSEDIKELADKLPHAGLLKRTEIAMWIMLSCCCRIGEIVKARWEHVDFEARTWTIPKENAKNKVTHTVYLSDFALSYFRQLQELSNRSAWCYPDASDTTHVCIKSTTKQIRDRQLTAQGRKPMANRTKRCDALILAGGDWVPHDLRRTGATMLQMLGVTPEIIEKVLNHVEPDKLRRTYQTYDYADEKREAWRLLGERLSLILNPSANVVVMRHA